MDNPFILSTEKLSELIKNYRVWMQANPQELEYIEKDRQRDLEISSQLLDYTHLQEIDNNVLYNLIFTYSRKLEGPAYIRLGEDRLTSEIPRIRENLVYIRNSQDDPMIVAENVIEGKYKIQFLAKSFWSPILQARFKNILPNWNNKTEDFFNRLGIQLKTSKLTISEKYQKLKTGFTFINEIAPELDFFDINHLMHYGTAIDEGKKSISTLLGEYYPIAPIPVKNYWIIGAGEKAKFWEEFQSQGKASIGLPPIGDLNQYETKEEIEAAIQTFENTDRRRYNDALAGYDFCQVMKPGDIIFVKRGNSEFLGYGEVTSEYFFDESIEYQHYRKVSWKKTGVWKEDMGQIVQKTLTNITDYPSKHPDYDKYYQRILAIINGTYSSPFHKTRDMATRFPLNQIFYGPPGTGKTYNTISEAIKIIDPEFFADHNQHRQEMQDKFNDLLITDWDRIEGKRIAFCTFHQSLSYEDFIEGIKPVEPEKEGDPVVYRIEEGLFHRLCTEAEFSIALKKGSKDQAQILDFSLAYDQFAQELEEKLSSNEVVELETKNGGKVLVDSVSRLGNIIIKHHGGTRIYTVSKNRVTKLEKAIENLDDVSNINEQFREIIGGSNSSAYWAVLNGIRQKKYKKFIPKPDRKYLWDEKKELIQTLQSHDFKTLIGDPYVLIIDEINRGNVSQIFGELITLIEDNKRLGNTDALQTVLPYSKSNFGVPSNLYVIGTMNTADRSVEALDTALRRRFTFREFMPDSELIKDVLGSIVMWKGIDLSEVFVTINHRIEILLDRDHQIGHSDFLALKETMDIDSDLKRIFTKKIIPLLQEYFYNDYVKVGMILGEGFVSTQKRDAVKFAHIVESLDADYADGYIYRLIPEDKIDLENALNQLMNKAANVQF